MKKVFRSIQTLFPFLQDARFTLKSYMTMITKTPVENDFNAVKMFKPGADQVFVDVGANRGHTILAMLLHPQFKNKIVAFEPNPLIVEKIKNNNYIKGNDQVLVHNAGLGNTNKDLTLFVPFYRKWMFDGLSSFSYEEASDWLKERLWGFDEKKLNIKKIVCKVKRLDDFKLNPYFVKIDVQGFELDVLKGGEETIKKHKPIFLIESVTPEIMAYLKPFGYLFLSYENGKFSEGLGILNTFCMTEEKYNALTSQKILAGTN